MAELDADAFTSIRQALGGPLLVHLSTGSGVAHERAVWAAQSSLRSGMATVLVSTSESVDQLLVVDGVPTIHLELGTEFLSLNRTMRVDRLAHDSWFQARRGVAGLQRRARSGETKARAILAWRKRGLLAQAVASSRNFDEISVTVGNRWWLRLPELVDLERTFGTALDFLRPAAIHAHGHQTLAIACHASSIARLRGYETAVIYDACTLSPQHLEPASHRQRAEISLQSAYIRYSDTVIAPNQYWADLLTKEFELVDPVSVVPSAIPRPTDGDDFIGDEPSIRSTCGLDEQDLLLVHHGDPADHSGVVRAIGLLVGLDDAHLAVVTNAFSPLLESALADSRRLGVSGRVHVVPPVARQFADSYFASGDLGLFLSNETATSASLPPGFADFLRARLPIVALTGGAIDWLLQQHKTGMATPSSADELAVVVREALSKLSALRAEITDSLIYEFSWEREHLALTGLHAEILKRGTVVPANPSLLGNFVSTIEVHPPLPPVGAPPRVTGGSARLGIGPANFAGQATRWAAAVAHELGISAVSFAYPSGFNYDVGYSLAPISYGDFRAMTDRLSWILQSFSHLIIDGYRPILGGLLGEDLPAEVDLLRRTGKAIGLLAHGSEIRDPQRHIGRMKFSYFSDVPADWRDQMQVITDRNAEIAQGFDGPLFVSTPDLLLDLPGATWVPVTIDIDRWSVDQPAMDRTLLRVLHAPSRSIPPIKGSRFLDPVLQSLHDQGHIDYIRVEGLPHSKMADLVRSVDIVVDQVSTGSYGVAAVEAMAAGRLVVGDVAPDVRRLMPEAPPIIDAPPDCFDAVMQNILDEPELFAEIARRGPVFANRWHNGGEAALAFASFLNVSVARPHSRTVANPRLL